MQVPPDRVAHELGTLWLEEKPGTLKPAAKKKRHQLVFDRFLLFYFIVTDITPADTRNRTADEIMLLRPEKFRRLLFINARRAGNPDGGTDLNARAALLPGFSNTSRPVAPSSIVWERHIAENNDSTRQIYSKMTN